MSSDAERQQAKMQEFMRLLPLTLDLAGLPRCEVGKQFTEEQMEFRLNSIRIAYKLARKLVIEISKPAE
ncbi:hypothetical protein [Tuwongella immobilis]|uniref:Uncharacterized protein n=1 Tax=Tuwongella immobilis TaxID=692036 RepID=A0A6C2YNB0_9BACT|nr:hypothetical protein [Tuwongella immobilis]VIP02382.1 Uncharacterized protein OS=Planctomyces limnophilus (strain ATCC 43296 / DSM 3776 / IFAM 1008 / 290) GN=Plim_2599 PE=4 SV=1 [Tuwongella immobilis]VTS01232.1 Uncharacterized protein OS=Planctomyces limnophilus (strain ATCC 43296 / DSM 3776 / IFAM 1008 / 290) GN=Plim_2599 PE=4 SV=1 [Tuwongella immobilis]